MGSRSAPTQTVRLLKQRRDELLEELRAVAPELVHLKVPPGFPRFGIPQAPP